MCENKIGPKIQNPQIRTYQKRVEITLLLQKKKLNPSGTDELKIHLKMLTHNGINTNWDTNLKNPQIIIFFERVEITILLQQKNMNSSGTGGLKIHLERLTHNGINTNWDTN